MFLFSSKGAVQADDDEEDEEEESDDDGEGWDSDETGTDVTHDEDPPDPASIADSEITTDVAKSSKSDGKKTEGSSKKAQKIEIVQGSQELGKQRVRMVLV